jgi:hypothetical protein
VRYLLEKGANRGLADADGHKPIDLIGTGHAGGRGGASGGGPAATAEIRTLLQSAGSNH